MKGATHNYYNSGPFVAYGRLDVRIDGLTCPSKYTTYQGWCA